jgi:hypothetical protein
MNKVSAVELTTPPNHDCGEWLLNLAAWAGGEKHRDALNLAMTMISRTIKRTATIVQVHIGPIIINDPWSCSVMGDWFSLHVATARSLARRAPSRTSGTVLLDLRLYWAVILERPGSVGPSSISFGPDRQRPGITQTSPDTAQFGFRISGLVILSRS